LGAEILPSGCEFLNASSDTGKTEYIANSALSHCDKMATRLLDSIQGREFDHIAFAIEAPSWFKRGRLLDADLVTAK